MPSAQLPPRLLDLHEVDIVCEVPWVSRHALLLQGTGIKHRLSLGLAAENNHEVGSHDSLAVLVKLNDAILGELGESHINHGNGTLDDLLTCSDDCLCLLSPLHLEPVMVLAAVLYGAGAALGTVGVSVWSVEFADPKNYARSIKNFQLAYSAGGFIANTFPGALKELTGSYMDTYALFFVLASAAMAIVVGIYASHRLRNCKNFCKRRLNRIARNRR